MVKCPLECYKTEYKTSVSSFQVIGDFFVDAIVENANLKEDFVTNDVDISKARDSIAPVNVYYDSLGYTYTTETPIYNTISLLASFGGNLGLFLGINMFSLCELVELLIEIYFIKIN